MPYAIPAVFPQIRAHLRRLPPIARLLAVAALLCLCWSAATSVCAARARLATVPKAERLETIKASLARIEGDYLLAAGDSHIAGWQAHALCGLPLVNAGMPGATTQEVAALLTHLAPRRAPRAVILTVGTNDANAKRFSGTAQAVRRFEGAFVPLLRQVSRQTRLLVVTDAPRLVRERVAGFSVEAAAGIEKMAEAACRATSSCRYVKTFADGEEPADGVHLSDYGPAYGAIMPGLCAALDSSRVIAAR